jgi:hypothetical protein
MQALLKQKKTLLVDKFRQNDFSDVDVFVSLAASQPGQVEELNMFKNRKTSIRRSARTGSVKGPIDPKGK